ncbi:hypothetical protein HUG20_08810 [Salicibibacter cibi]|uniref:Uncharacterized protein n=1 Tax=Salicibibacter cibi TaxID=2743001 RepID=A0A7T6ZAW8_9BACI|nr:hypothetical protein [Salicibibacter cibi]QQK79977.1 hypothetical protein HUG20_08810 [Salicibibacter cibi]
MQGKPSYKQKTLALLATYGGTVLQWRDSSGKNGCVKTPQRRFCARRLDRSSAESEAMEATSRLQLIAASCSAFLT